MKGGSGLYINANDKDAFYNFISNAKPKLLTSGLTGVAFEYTLDPHKNSDYLSLDASNYGMPVQKLLVKASFVLPIETRFNYIQNREQKSMKSVTSDDFYQEVNIQTDVYLKTMQYLQPLCPAIVYADILDIIVNINTPIVTTMISRLPRELRAELMKYPGLKIGLIGMELMQDTENMFYLLLDHNYYISYLSKMLFALIELAVKTGYNHGDFHSGNFLFETKISNYFKGKLGRVVVIDFGFTEKLPSDIYKTIKSLYSSKRYSEILSLLCNIPRKDGFDMRTWDGYLTTCLRKNPEFNNIPYTIDKNIINAKIEELYVSRDAAIQDLVTSFTQKHLPLSNAEKNNMYTGVIIDKPLATLSFNFIRNTPSNKDIFDSLIGKIFYVLAVQPISKIEQLKYAIKACYNFVYLLNINFALEELTIYVALFYTGIFDKDWFTSKPIISNSGYSNSSNNFSVFGTPSPPPAYDESVLTIINNMLGGFLNEQIIYYTIVINAKSLENVRFDTILNYLSDNLLEPNLSTIVQGMATPTPYEEPQVFAQQLVGPKTTTSSSSSTSPSNNFNELPFNETTGGKYRKRYTKKTKAKKSKSRKHMSKSYSRNKK
jgi:hypothetical protein